MLQGRTIQQVQELLNTQLKTKFDFLVPTSFLSFTPEGKMCNKDSGKAIDLTEHAHSQMASFLDIPTAYYHKMRVAEPQLLAENVNRWMSKTKSGTRRLVRTLDGRCRAFLSDRYLPIDNHDVVKYLLPTIEQSGCQIESAEVTENKMYIKAVTPRVTGEVKVGDKVQAGIIIQNSEIGCGRIEVSPLIYRLACKNGMIINELSNKRHHVGRRAQEEDIGTFGIYSKQTIMADITAFLLKARDSVKAALNQSVFSQVLAKMQEAAGIPITNFEEVMEDVSTKYSISDAESKFILQNMISGGDPTKYGLVNAITFAAHNQVTDYDRSVELERIGGSVLYSKI